MANTITIDGTLGREPDLRYTNAGQAVCRFSVANNRRWKNREDEWVEKTSWFNVTVWGDLGENVAQSLHKGDRVIVFGRMDQGDDWENDAGEVQKGRLELVADDVAPSLRWATTQIEKTQRRQAAE